MDWVDREPAIACLLDNVFSAVHGQGSLLFDRSSGRHVAFLKYDVGSQTYTLVLNPAELVRLVPMSANYSFVNVKGMPTDAQMADAAAEAEPEEDEKAQVERFFFGT